jgi:lysophospholipase L1-like esterase
MKKIFIALLCSAVMPFAVLQAQPAVIAANEKVEKADPVTVVASTNGTKLYVVGDSTLSAFNDPYFYPRYGYGTKLQDYLDPAKIEVINLAMSGRSSLSFLAETNYQTLKNNIKEGDYLLIGFGHNDEKAEKSRYTNPNGTKEDAGSFKNILYENYIKLALEKKATPVLCTPIVRRAPGKPYDGPFIHIVADQEGFPGGDYPGAIRELGKECRVTVVDNTAMTKALYEKLGDDRTLKLHAWLSHKPESVDNTHLNTYGASVVAYLVVTDLAKQNADFASFVRKDIAGPTEAVLIKNPAYNIPEYDGFTPTDKSTVWKTTAPWYASVFGDAGGAEKIANKDLYEITETGSGVSMHSGTKDGSVSAGKIASASDGLAFYFQQIPIGRDFTLSATAKINNVGKNNQVSFGLMVRDDIYIDKFDNTVKSDYVACGALKIANGDGGWQSSFQRHNGTLNGTNAAAEPCPAAGRTVALSITKTGSTYTVQYGKEAPVTYAADLTEIDDQYVYAGLYTVRSAYIDFSTISLTVH